MTTFDQLYSELCTDVINNGIDQPEDQVRARLIGNREVPVKAPARAVFGRSLTIPQGMVPVLRSKKFSPVFPLYELAWIWQKKSNDVSVLRKLGTTIWDEWEHTSGMWRGTIGPAYGWVLAQQVRKFPLDKLHPEHLDKSSQYRIENGYILLDQVDHLIQSLLSNPGSRQNVVTLWDIHRVDEMALPPCVWSTNWDTHDGNLNLKVNIRSNDLALGNPYNVYQYFVLQQMIAQVTGYTPGVLKFDIDNPHVYTHHIRQLKEQISEPLVPEPPTFWINPDVKNFYEFNMDTDFKVNFKFPTNRKVKAYKFEVAV